VISADPTDLLTIQIPDGTLEVEECLEPFLPPAFVADPMRYFDEQGVRVREGDVTRDEAGRITDDPTAVRDFPVWSNPRGEAIRVVCKRVNRNKSQVRRTGDPFYEYRILQLVRALGFVTARPVGRIAQAATHFIITERSEGLRWVQRWDAGLKKIERDRIRAEAEVIMARLQAALTDAGIRRPWNIKDMILQLDADTRAVRAVIPVDWEQAKLDFDRLRHASVEHLLRELRRGTD
jgi:hypothetical protein